VSEREGALARLTAEIAQREHAEAALVQAQKIEAVGQLTGGIAHDFNNLLQAIGGNVDLIRRKPDDPGRIARWAEAAAKAVDSGARLTGQLLAFSRTQRLELKRVDPNALVAGMVEMVRRSIGPAIELKTALAPESGVVEADRTQLELAILNLAINARDAMPEGGTLIISTRALTIEPGDDLAPGDYCEIGVSDTGIGMAPDVLQRALEPFYTTKGVGQGTGLGLSMAFGMARQSGGTLRIGSSENEGTTVTILLRRAAGEENGRERVEEGDLPRAPRAGLRVAVVDDDDHVRDVIADTLEGLGYAALPYPDGPTALRALDVAAPDLMILDFAMPGMNGAEVARQVRIACPDLGIIFVSGYSDSAAIDAVMDARMAIMRKPFQASDLARLVEARLAA
jgi:CheY-like chemotaxis protein